MYKTQRLCLRCRFFFQGSRVFIYNATSAHFNDRVWIGQLLFNMSSFHFITILFIFNVHPFTYINSGTTIIVSPLGIFALLT